MEKEDIEICPEYKNLDDKTTTHSNRTRGGLITMPFIIANEAFEKLASYGILTNMITYLLNEYHTSVGFGTNLLFIWTAATNFFPIIGAFLSDSFLGRFLTIGFGSVSSLLGMILLWLTSMIPSARPQHCIRTSPTCKTPTRAQLAFLISSFGLISIGAGGVRPCSLAFGADQLNNKDNSKNYRVLEIFFSWYYACSAVSLVIAFTGVVYIQDQFGWKVGFGVPAIIMLFSTLLFLFASPFYVKQKASKSLFTGLAQVIVVTYRNRKLASPPKNSDGWYHYHKGAKLVLPTEKLRFLNKACMIRNKERDVTSEGVASSPWRLCSVEQVEELKALIKVFPLWSTGIAISINVSQTTFLILQAGSMDRHLTSNIKIPAASFTMFVIISLTIWIGLYDRVLIPLASKLRGKPIRIDAKYRMGIGLLFSCVSITVSGFIEHVRRKKALQQGFQNNAAGIVDMSAMWLIVPHSLNGIAEAFNSIGQTEFFYSEFPKSMSSIAACLAGLTMAVANMLASVIVSTVDHVTKRGGNASWVSTNINQGHLDYYYWLLSVVSLVNLGYFLVCSWAYGPSVAQMREDGDKRKDKLGLLKIGAPMPDQREESTDEEESGLSKLSESPS